MPTVAFVGAKGGQGTTTVAAAFALMAAQDGHKVALSGIRRDDLCTVLGMPDSQYDDPIYANPSLLITTAGVPLTGSFADEYLHVIDAGTVDNPWPLEAYTDTHVFLVLRGPCYVALRRALKADVRPEAIVLLMEEGRSLQAADITDVLNLPVSVEMPVNPSVARTIDAGLLVGRIPAALRPLRNLPVPMEEAS